MGIKLLGLGCKEYARDGYNWIDAAVVISAVLEMSLTGFRVFTVMRGCRLLRFLKLARSWTAFRNLLRWLGQTLVASIMFIILFTLCMFVFVLIGMELYAYNINFDEDGNALLQQAKTAQKYPPRANFNSIWNGFTTIFIVAIGDDWNKIMYDYYRVMYHSDSEISRHLPILFFVVTYVTMNMLLLNLFLAILLDSYGDKRDYETDVKE